MQTIEQRIKAAKESIARGEYFISRHGPDCEAGKIWLFNIARAQERIERLEHRLLLGRLEP